MGILYHVVMKCRKMRIEQTVPIPETYRVEEALTKLARLEEADCPVCGEEPDGNWLFARVRKVVSNK